MIFIPLPGGFGMNVAVKATKHAAPGPYLGFALQPVRLCFHLLTCPAGAKVSLEYLDDVAVHYADGSVLLEQTKSALKQNPISDWSDELWKCFANWTEGIAAGKIAPECSSFQLYVTPAKQGDWAQALSNAKTASDLDALFATINAKRTKSKKPKACDAYIDSFLNAPPAVRNAIALNFTLASSETDPIDSLRNQIKATVDPRLVDDVCHAAVGRAKEQIDRLIRAGQPPQIDGDAFKAAFRAFVRTINIPGLLTSLTSPPPKDQVEAVLSTRPVFIRQLEIIGTSEDERVRAVSDFLRASADKSVWAEQGLVYADGLNEWDNSLIGRHSFISAETSDLHADKDGAFRGRMTYRRCAQLEAPLEGRAVPMHFVHGSYNALADIMRLGWHPDYQSLLQDKK